jgi:hypothetical protein
MKTESSLQNVVLNKRQGDGYVQNCDSCMDLPIYSKNKMQA